MIPARSFRLKVWPWRQKTRSESESFFPHKLKGVPGVFVDGDLSFLVVFDPEVILVFWSHQKHAITSPDELRDRHHDPRGPLADTVSKARSIMGNSRFSLFILDIRLPDGNGIELCRWIRWFDVDTPVLIYAATNLSYEEVLAAGADAFAQVR